jgi:hypothetical protein
VRAPWRTHSRTVASKTQRQWQTSKGNPPPEVKLKT